MRESRGGVVQIQIAASFHASLRTSRRNRERALARSESRPNGTDKRINAKIQDTGPRAPVYFSPAAALGESR